MSVRSGVFIKYVLEFKDAAISAGGGLAAAAAAVVGAGGLPLKVSNDVLAGDFCIDADISVKMHRGAAGTDFEITIYDLPESKAKLLKDSPFPRVTVSLGYFDTSVAEVLHGVCETVDTSASNEKLVTKITGRESAFFACATTCFTGLLEGDNSFANAITKLFSVAKKKLPDDFDAKNALVTNDLPAGVLSNKPCQGSILNSIDEIVGQANAEFFISDKRIYVGAPIKNGQVDPAQLDYAVNLAKFDPIIKQIRRSPDCNAPDPPKQDMYNGFKFTVIGDPTMRPGQKLAVKDVKGFNGQEFRIRNIEHSFSSSQGYCCVGVATELLTDGAKARRIDQEIDSSAMSAAAGIANRIRSQGAENPIVEVTAVKSAGDAYVADLYYGQAPAGAETQPSIKMAVNQQGAQVYPQKPIMSPFAWRKCGLVTPIYPGMKAVVLHNRAQASDAIVTGYIWSKKPDFAPPANHSGDWWLCLPIDFDPTQPPSDLTKAVNDITANNGCRVIELKGLKITVGAEGLKEVGKRPAPEDSSVAETCTIAHASGAVITLSSSGITLTDGKLKVQLANGKLAIG